MTRFLTFTDCNGSDRGLEEVFYPFDLKRLLMLMSEVLLEKTIVGSCNNR